ncbi:MAG: VOC family protein, partial [Gammaproteobacteria bacterium]|nr:VOC family protein [Gammaproteobacteria bacterium]
MHRSRLGGIIIDCETDDLDAATAFWSQALGYPAGTTPAEDAGRYLALQAP